MKKLLILLCLPIFFTSCFPTKEMRIVKTHEEVMNEHCKNKNKSEILLKLGPPDRSTDDGKNGEILIYDDSVERTSSRGITSFYKIFGVPMATSNTSAYRR